MLKKIVTVLVILFSFLRAENYIDIYRKNGIDAVQKLFEKKLMSYDYWKEYLKDFNTSYGYFEKSKYIIVTNKESKKLKLFFTDGKGSLKQIFTKEVILGKKGEKKREGDLITPLGAYKITMKFKPKDTYYGPLAFSLSYPNIFDIVNGRDGHGIWIHGYPLDHEKRPAVTKGCMVLKNSELADLSRKIDPQNTFVIIHQNNLKKIKKSDIAKILTLLYSWKNAWKKSDIDRYLSFYAKDFKRYNGENYKQFSKEKRRIFAKKEKKNITFKYISILPYPNLKNEPLYKVVFYEIYNTKHYHFKGNKELYVRVGKKTKIVVEK